MFPSGILRLLLLQQGITCNLGMLDLCRPCDFDYGMQASDQAVDMSRALLGCYAVVLVREAEGSCS
jgi:hypothetical protein